MGKVGRITVWVLGVALAAVVAAMVWQHLRYLDARRNVLHDLQDVVHSDEALHAVTFLEVAPGADLFDAVRPLRAATDAFPGARTVYAGKVAMNALSSIQLIDAIGDATVAWDAVVLAQFDDRATYDASRKDAAVQAALDGFATTYTHGMKRPPGRQPAAAADAPRVEDRPGRHVPAFRPALRAGVRRSGRSGRVGAAAEAACGA